jgi:hypothetical protein
MAEQVLGKGYTAHAMARLGTADLQPNGELGLVRSDGRRTMGVNVFRRLEAANDWGAPLTFGPSLSAFLFGRDEGFYYRTAGAELVGTLGSREGVRWRLFGERHSTADVETKRSLAGSKFRPNITATAGDVVGLGTIQVVRATSITAGGRSTRRSRTRSARGSTARSRSVAAWQRTRRPRSGSSTSVGRRPCAASRLVR